MEGKCVHEKSTYLREFGFKKGIFYEAMLLVYKTIIMLMLPYWSSLVHALLVMKLILIISLL